jgi:hypothetical protein
MDTQVTEKGFSDEFHSLKRELINQDTPISHKDYFQGMLRLSMNERKTLIGYMNTYDPKLEMYCASKDALGSMAIMDAFESVGKESQIMFLEVAIETHPEVLNFKKTA